MASYITDDIGICPGLNSYLPQIFVHLEPMNVSIWKSVLFRCNQVKMMSYWIWGVFSWPFPWRRKWQPTPVFLPGESHGRRSLVGYSPWGRKELDTTERLHFTFTSLCSSLLFTAKKKKIEAVADKKMNHPQQNGIQKEHWPWYLSYSPIWFFWKSYEIS